MEEESKMEKLEGEDTGVKRRRWNRKDIENKNEERKRSRGKTT